MANKHRHTKKELLEYLTKDVPRGLTSRFLKTQSEPQAQWQSPEKILGSTLLSYDPHNPGSKILIGALGDKLIGIEDNRRHPITVEFIRTLRIE